MSILTFPYRAREAKNISEYVLLLNKNKAYHKSLKRECPKKVASSYKTLLEIINDR